MVTQQLYNQLYTQHTCAARKGLDENTFITSFPKNNCYGNKKIMSFWWDFGVWALVSEDL